MKIPIKLARSFYAIALLIYGSQQFYFSNFRPVFLPKWQTELPALIIWAYLFGIGLIVVGLAIIFEKKAHEASLILGWTLFLLCCLVHVPYEIFADPNNKIFGVWASALKELALAGGAFVVAGSFYENRAIRKKSSLKLLVEKLIPLGRIFFSITMVSFGIMHFLYTRNVATIVPGWIPNPVFWTYFAGVALIGSGLAIILKIRTREIGTLLGIMIFLWFIILHLPRAIDNPVGNRGNELASALDALAFSGIAFLIAFNLKSNKRN